MVETIDPHQINFNKVSYLQSMLVISGIFRASSNAARGDEGGVIGSRGSSNNLLTRTG